MRYDAESLVSDVLAIVTANLNTKLLEIDSEKADGITMFPVPAAAYFFQDFSHELAASYDVFCYYGLEDPVTDGIGPHTSENHTLYFVIMLKETAETQVFTQRLMRYSRALTEILQSGWQNNRNRCKLSISSISPTRFSEANKEGAYRAVGVKIQTTLA